MSKKCIHYATRASVVKDDNKIQHDEVAILGVIEDTNQQETTIAVDSSRTINTNSNSNNNNDVDVNTNIDSTSNNNDIDISSPEFMKLNFITDLAYKPVVGVASKDFKYRKLFLNSLKWIIEAGNLKSQYRQTIYNETILYQGFHLSICDIVKQILFKLDGTGARPLLLEGEEDLKSNH